MEPADVEDVDVLLVDDDTEWLAVASRSLAGADEALTVLTAAAGGEALDVVDRESVDCVVCDYRMPHMDGIEVLERIRSDQGDLPFILVTGSGSEDVASEAISSDVTDYFVKDPGRDQSGTLAARIRSAVAAHRTSEELATARRRFTSLFENVPDPVVVVDGGTIYRTNDAFDRTFGVGGEDARGESLDEVLDDFPEGGDGPTVSDISVPTTEGTREFLVRRFGLGSGGDAVGYVFTDVTDHRERRRDLERALDLDSEVRELFLSATTRKDLERSFCETLVSSDGCEYGAVVESGQGDSVTVRVSADGDLEAGELSDRWPVDVPPVRATLADRSSRYVELDGEDWARSARLAGGHGVLVVPVDRNGVPDGAFVLYGSDPGTFADARRERVEDLVSSLGDAVELVERMGALAADSVIRVQLSVEGDGPLSAAAEVTGSAVDVESVRRTGDGTATYVDLPSGDDGGGTGLRRLSEHADVDSVESVVEGPVSRVRVECSGRSLPGVVVDRGGSVHSLRVGTDGYEVTVDVPPSGDVSGLVEAVESAFESVTVHSIRSQERDDGTSHPVEALDALTEKQREALRTAYVEGYFETPRERSAEEVAESLEIAGSTFLQHLRTAERKLLSSLVPADPPQTGEQ